MPPSEKQMSPEEKLLKVIQGSDQGKPSRSVGEEKLLKAVQGSGKGEQGQAPGKLDAALKTVAVESKVKEPALSAKQDAATKAKPAPKTDRADLKGGTDKVAEESGKSGAKPKLKVAKSEERARAAEVTAVDPPKAAEIPKTAAAGPIKKVTGRKFSVRAVNSWLAMIVLVSLCLSAYQMWAGVQSSRENPQLIPHITASPVNEGPPSRTMESTNYIQKVLDSFANKDMFNWNAGVVTTATQTAPTADWIIYAKENLRLKAFMGDVANGTREAIVTDKANQGRMSFLKQGQKFAVGSQDVTVREIQSDQVIVTDGIREQAIK
jgi:hypothetical protein